MKFRDILAIEQSGRHTAVNAIACQLAHQNDGAVTSLLVAAMPALIMTEGWLAAPVWDQARRELQTQLDARLGEIRRQLDAHPARVRQLESTIIESDEDIAALVNRARHHDVCIVGAPRTGAEHRLVEALLFNTGRPVILAPDRWEPQPLGRSVIVAWKPTREAARALAEADDLLSCAFRRVILQVDTGDDADKRCQAGEAVVEHLKRRGITAENRVIACVGSSEAEAILAYAEAASADLVVMGAYGRPRATEFIFGGVTRDVLTETRLPILMAH